MTRVPFTQAFPWQIAGSVTMRSRQFTRSVCCPNTSGQTAAHGFDDAQHIVVADGLVGTWGGGRWRADVGGLDSAKLGRPSHRRLLQATRERALNLIRERYLGFGPTFACEKLVDVHWACRCILTLFISRIWSKAFPVLDWKA